MGALKFHPRARGVKRPKVMLVDGFFPREFRIGHETRERTIYKAAHHYNIYTAQSEFPGAQHFENGTLLWS